MSTTGRSKANSVVTGRGKNKDQYGRKFGKVQKFAMLEFTKSMWTQDAEASIRNILKHDIGKKCLLEFLKMEYNEDGLQFVIDAQKLDSIPENERKQFAINLYNCFMQSKMNGIGQQERTNETQKLWDTANSSENVYVNENSVLQKIKEECDVIMNSLALDAFPRFIQSKYCNKVLEVLRSQGNNEMDGVMNSMNMNAPKDADEWLNSFVSIAESLPACIVISDMTIPGAPMVYVNDSFCNTTGYSRGEATGRNCRFLQGPETEPDAIQVIRSTLSKGTDCHVKLTNYRKNGDKFQNLLSMRPVFDADNIYRYVIGVQFELKNDANLKPRLIQLDKLLRLLPSKLPFKSKASSRAKGMMAVKTSGEANDMVKNKEYIEKQASMMETQENIENKDRPKSIMKTNSNTNTRLNYDLTNAAFTKIMWLNNVNNSCRGVLLDELGRTYFKQYIESNCSKMLQTQFEFFENGLKCRTTEGAEQLKQIRKSHMKMVKNEMFYCTTNEIQIGTLDSTDWAPIFQNMCGWHDQTIQLFVTIFPQFLDSNLFNEYISKLSAQEKSGINSSIQTCACEVDLFSDVAWLEMFKIMSENVKCGMVVSDMTVPGIPLVYINEGFKNVTGYGKEKIGTSCKFLQGKDTEDYLNDEIMTALQQNDKLLIKLHNYKQNGEKFQCLFALHPVFGAKPDYEYKYQIGIQMDFKASPDIKDYILEMELVLKYLPDVITGEPKGINDIALNEGNGQSSMSSPMGGMGQSSMSSPMGGMGQSSMSSPMGGMGQPSMSSPMGGMGQPSMNEFSANPPEHSNNPSFKSPRGMF